MGLAIGTGLTGVEWWLRLAIAAAVTDFLDGALARSLGAQSRFGAAFDLVTDGVFFGAVFLRFWLAGMWPTWIAAAILAAVLPEAIAQIVLLVKGRPGSPGRFWNRVAGGYSYACVIAVAAGWSAIAMGLGQVAIVWWANLLDLRWAVVPSRRV